MNAFYKDNETLIKLYRHGDDWQCIGGGKERWFSVWSCIGGEYDSALHAIETFIDQETGLEFNADNIQWANNTQI